MMRHNGYDCAGNGTIDSADAGTIANGNIMEAVNILLVYGYTRRETFA